MKNKSTGAETRRRGDAEKAAPRISASPRLRVFFSSMRLPLSAKILVWFFLNLAVLAAVFVLLFNAQFRFDLDWVFASSAGQRAETMRNVIVNELNAAQPDDWEGMMERFSAAYGIRLALFESNGEHLIGAIDELPQEVRQRIQEQPRQRTQASPSPVPSPVSREAANRPRTGNTSRAFLRTSKPAGYWLVQRVRLENPQAGGTMRVILVAQSDSLSMGGLILDPVPWLGLIVGPVVFSVLFWFPLLHGITRSIGGMMQTTRQIAEGRFEVRVATRRRDELGSLAESINQMATRLSGFVKGQKRFLGDIAHELCSPLARLQMVLGIMEQRAGDGAQGDYAKSASEKARQIAALVNELLVFSRASFGATAVRLVSVPVEHAVQEALRRDVSDAVEIKTEIADGLLVMADRELLVRALSNLLRNAIHHGGTGSIYITAAKEDGLVSIRVADSGPGVPEEELPKLFDAFYRLDSARMRETGGVGLGLTIVKTCVESCSGSVVARNRQPHGLEVEIRLPVGE